MNAREAILERVRAALARRPQAAIAEAPPPLIRVPAIDDEGRLELFAERLQALGGTVSRAGTLEDAREIAARLTAGCTAVASNARILVQSGISSLPGVRSGFHSEPELREACRTASMGITGADFALAETGSLVLFASEEEARLVSLLPPVHLAVLDRARLLTGLDELFERVPRPSDRSSSMILITGPSRSADIEMILVRGVHGPGALHVIVVDEALERGQ